MFSLSEELAVFLEFSAARYWVTDVFQTRPGDRLWTATVKVDPWRVHTVQRPGRDYALIAAITTAIKHDPATEPEMRKKAELLLDTYDLQYSGKSPNEY